MTLVATREALVEETRSRSRAGFGIRALRGCGGALALAAVAELGSSIAAHGLPLPGPVIGLSLLALGLTAAGALHRSLGRSAAAALGPATQLSLRHMGLLFVPAGVGIVTQGDVLRALWLPALAGLVGSTLVAIVVTGFLLHRFGGPTEDRS